MTFTTAWTHLTDLTFDQLALLVARADDALNASPRNARWLARWDRLTAELARRGVVSYCDDLGRWAVGYADWFGVVA